jgi:hypothetical protein
MARVELIPSKSNTPRYVTALGITAFYGWLYFSQWIPLKVQNIGGGRNYTDLASVLNAAQCYERIGDSVYSTVDTCGYQYGIFLLRFINLLNLDSINLELLGGVFFLIGFLILLGVAVYSASTGYQALMIFIFAISPGPWLLFERGNLDLLILMFVSLAVLFINSRLSILGILFIALTALMKFYTLPLLLVYVVVEKRLYLRIIGGITVGIVTPFVIFDISRAPSFPNPTFAAFGLPSPGLWLNFFAWRFNVPVVLDGPLQYLVGFLFLFVGFYLIYFSGLSKKFPHAYLSSPSGSVRSKNAFLFFSSLYLICYLAGMNFDYRLVFLILALLLLNVVFPSGHISRWFTTVQIAALWSTYFFFGATGAIPVLLAIFGNICQLILAIYLLGPIYRILEPSSALKPLVDLLSKLFRKAS